MPARKFGGFSGAHVNPAVTAGLMITGRIKPPLAMLYVVAQLLGASIAALTRRAVFPDGSRHARARLPGASTPALPGREISPMEAVNAGMLGIPLPAAWAGTGTIFCVEF